MIYIESPIQYLFEVSCCLLAFYLFYHWVLGKETFFQFNRFYLLFTPIISLLLPTFQIGQIENVQQQTPQTLEFIPKAIQGFQQTEVIFHEKINTVSIGIGFTWGEILLSIYLLGVACFLIVFLRKLWTVRNMLQSNPIEKKEHYQQVILPKIKTPFSFFNTLFWNGKMETETPLMLAHEQVHIRQRHSIDVIVMEILVAFFWFHPLVYLFRRAIKMTHEYLADQNVTQYFGRRKEYATLLLASATNQTPTLASTFNSFVKNRLDMIYKKRTPMIQYWKLLTLLPLTLALTLLFSCDQVKSISNNPVGEMVNQAKNGSEELLKKEVVQTGIGDILKSNLDAVKESFDVSFEINQPNKEGFNLAVNLELNKGAYIISPFSKDTTYGHFYITLEENEHFIADNKLLETPPSVEEFDPVLEAPVKFVRVNTTYKQTLQLTTQEDFEVNGVVEFLLEPICIPYDVEFKVSRQGRKVQVEKIRTVISSEYKM